MRERMCKRGQPILTANVEAWRIGFGTKHLVFFSGDCAFTLYHNLQKWSSACSVRDKHATDYGPLAGQPDNPHGECSPTRHPMTH